MKGLGSFGNGGSASSSSNLSALAPPFTVDRSNPKPSSNPLIHFTEPPYAVSFNSSLHNWQYSHSSASRPDFLSNPVMEVDSIRTTCLPSSNDYRYSGSQSIPSPSTHWPPLNPGLENVTDAFSYLQYSGGIPTSLVDSKPYYSPYVPPVVDDDTPLVALNEPTYDLLSSSHVIPLDESSQVDYTQSLSGLEYTPQWGGIWNGLVDGEQGKRTDLNRSFCSEEMNVVGPYAYKNYMKQGACVAESLSKCEEDSAISKRKSIDVLRRKNHGVSLSTGQLNDKSFLAQNPSFIPVESSRTSMLGSTSILLDLQGPSLESTTNSWKHQKPYNPSYEKCFQPLDYCMNDVLGRENHGVSLSTGQLNDKSFLAQNPSFIPVESSRTSMLGSSSILSESHPQGPYLEATTNSWNHQKPYNPSYEKCFQPLDYCMNDCISVTKSSPALVIRPPAIGTAPSAPNTVPYETVNFIDNVAAVNSEEFNGYNPLKITDPYLPVSSEFKERYLDTSQLSFHLERNNPIFVASSSNEKEELPNKLVTKDALDHTFKARSGFQVPDINVPRGSTLAVDGAKAVSSAENSSESLDHHNPAVDSPCWKGAPASHYSPFEVSKVGTPQHLVKTLEASNSLNVQGIQILPPYTDDTLKVSSQKPCENSVQHENGCVGNGLSLSPNRSLGANCAAKEHGSDDAVKAGLDFPKLSSSNGIQFSTDVDNPKKEYYLPNDSKCDSNFKSSHTKQPILEGGDFTSKIQLKIQAAVADVEVNTNDASEDGCVPSKAMKNILNADDASEDGCLPSKAMESVSCLLSGEGAGEFAKLHVGVSTPKMKVQMLVNAMHNLSELLLFHCSNDASALNEQNHEALGHTINNLDACISKKIARMSPTRESMFSQQGISHKLGELPDLHEGTSAGRPKVTREAAVNSHGQLNCQCMHEENMNYNVYCKKADKFPALVFLRDDADRERDDNMVQAVKNVLNDNFHGEEETQSQTLLYKNLWLEAEAALCSISYRARYDRLKIEMEKCKSHKAKDVSEDTRAVEKLPSSDVPPPNLTHRLTPETKDSPIPDTSAQDSPSSSTTCHVNDVEASVMARFHILKCRGDNSNSVNMEGQQLPEVVDAAFAGKRNCWPFVGDQLEGGILEVELEPHLGHHTGRAHFDRLKIEMEKCKSHEAKDVSEDARAVEKLPSYDVSPDPNITHRLTPEVKDSLILDTSAQDSPISSTTSRVNDVEASVMTRFQILKCRGENSNSVNMEGQKLPEVVDAAFAGKRNCWPFVGDQSEGGILDVEPEPYLEHHTGNRSEDKFGSYVDGSDYETVKEFCESVTDGPVTQSCRKPLSVWYDNSSSDWEHVLKDEFLLQN